MTELQNLLSEMNKNICEINMVKTVIGGGVHY